MLSDQRMWRFERPGSDKSELPVVELPGEAVIQAVSVLIEYESAIKATIQFAELDNRTSRNKFATIVREVLGSQTVGWWTRSSGELVLQEEPRAMLDDETIKQRDAELEVQLKRIVSRPELAAEAFPDEEMRKKIVPLFERVRRIGEAAAVKSKSEK